MPKDHDKKGTTKSSLCSTLTSSSAVTALLSISVIYKEKLINLKNYKYVIEFCITYNIYLPAHDPQQQVVLLPIFFLEQEHLLIGKMCYQGL